MERRRGRLALIYAGLLILLAFFSLSLAAIWSVPSELHLHPGEVGRIKVGFPLSLLPPETAKSFLIGSVVSGSELVFRTKETGSFRVALKIFGLVRARQVEITIVPERYVIASGQAIGVLLAAQGVVVVGHQTLRDPEGSQHCPAREAGILIGDVILTIDGISVHHAEDLSRLTEQAASRSQPVHLTIRRSGRILTRVFAPVYGRLAAGDSDVSPRAMLGLYVEDPAAGVGTMTFYDPAARTFAALGHRITELGGQRQVTLEGGKIVAARISGIEQGQRGDPGEKVGTFSGPDDIIGTIIVNSRFGLFGRLSAEPLRRPEIPVALAQQVHPGSATILTVLQGNEVDEFTVEIVRVYRQSRPHDKGMIIKVTDPRLLDAAGGIVQGMSGSPVIQDGRLAGAITHVFVNDPTRGYGVMAEWMVQVLDTMDQAQAA